MRARHLRNPEETLEIIHLNEKTLLNFSTQTIFRHQKNQGKLDHQLEGSYQASSKIVFWQKRTWETFETGLISAKNSCLKSLPSQNKNHFDVTDWHHFAFLLRGMFKKGAIHLASSESTVRAPRLCMSSENKMDWLTGMILTCSSTKTHSK